MYKNKLVATNKYTPTFYTVMMQLVLVNPIYRFSFPPLCVGANLNLLVPKIAPNEKEQRVGLTLNPTILTSYHSVHQLL